MEFRRVTSQDFHLSLVKQEAGTTEAFHVIDLDIFAISYFTGEKYMLGFIYPKIRFGLNVPCDRLEDETSAKRTLRDVPWDKMKLDIVITLYPLRCFDNGSEGALSLKLNIEPHWAMYNWARIARALLEKEAESYLKWLMSRYGPVDAVKIVGESTSSTPLN